MPPPRHSRKKKVAPARWQARTKPSKGKPRVVIVGFGRLGGALAVGLKKAGWPVAVLPRSDQSVRRAAKLNLPLADHDMLRSANLCVLAVPDTVVGYVANKVRGDLGDDTALLHCAGALDLSVLGTDPEMIRRPRGSFHPLCAVTDPLDELEGHSVALAASQRELMPVLWRMALALRLTPLEVPEARRAAYHAGAVMSAGLLVSLASAAVAAMEQAGILEDQAVAALTPLMRSAIRGLEERGLSRALTGPVSRGDLSVVQAHLAALPADLAEIYRTLSLHSLQLVKDQLPPETRNALERALKG
jgi:predicted short-subunit dehydrogenase-like oxidoreductase (DUF2520 family)